MTFPTPSFTNKTDGKLSLVGITEFPILFLSTSVTSDKDLEVMAATTTGMNDLPIEMQLEVFENLSLHELVLNSSKVSLQWREIIAQFILRSKVLRLAKVNGNFKRDIEKEGWSQEANQSELILSLYKKYEFHSSKLS